MDQENIFEKEKPKTDIFFRGRVWNADRHGKCTGDGDYTMIVGSEYIWFSVYKTIPLYWVTEVEPVGPGFQITWKNDVNGEIIKNTFCIRKLFFHDEEKRDRIIQAIKLAKERAEQTGAQRRDASKLVCFECGSTDIDVYNFIKVSSIAFYAERQIDRILLCRKHALPVFKYIFFSNIILSFLGLMPFLVRDNIENVKLMYEKRLIDEDGLKKYKLLARIRLFILIAAFLVFLFILVSHQGL